MRKAVHGKDLWLMIEEPAGFGHRRKGVKIGH